MTLLCFHGIKTISHEIQYLLDCVYLSLFYANKVNGCVQGAFGNMRNENRCIRIDEFDRIVRS